MEPEFEAPYQALRERGYVLERLLGQGSYGRVFLAAQHGANWQRPVAIKLLRPAAELGPGPALEAAKARLRAEVAWLIRCQPHAHWVQIFADHTAAEPPFFVMEYLPASRSLAAVLEQAQQNHRWVPLEDCRRFFLGVCRGLQHLHEGLGLVHRDIKLDNVLVAVDGPGWQTKLIDLGAAHNPAAGGGGTAESTILGTPLHQPPELLQPRPPGQPLGPSVDLFAVGVALYTLLTGVYPFASEAQIVDPRAVPCPPSAFRSVPPAFEAVVLKLLDKDPRRRFASAAEAGRALEGLQLGRPGIRQRRHTLMGLAAGVGLGAALFGGYYWVPRSGQPPAPRPATFSPAAGRSMPSATELPAAAFSPMTAEPTAAAVSPTAAEPPATSLPSFAAEPAATAATAEPPDAAERSGVGEHPAAAKRRPSRPRPARPAAAVPRAIVLPAAPAATRPTPSPAPDRLGGFIQVLGGNP
jgi:hypothetical protein